MAMLCTRPSLSNRDRPWLTRTPYRPLVGELDLRVESFHLADDYEQMLLTSHAEPGSPSAEALRLLASWGTAATRAGAGMPPAHGLMHFRYSLLRPEPAQRARLAEIRDNLIARIAEAEAEAEAEGWLGVAHIQA
jgi:hypothetical protein